MISEVPSSDPIIERLNSIEAMLDRLINQPNKEFYSTQEVADLLSKAEFTVREWCRLKRINAIKRGGRGLGEWRISHREFERIRNEGLLPVPDRY